MSNCLQLHLNLLKTILVVQFVIAIAEPVEHTIGNTFYKEIGRLEFQFNHFSYIFVSLRICDCFVLFILFKEKVFREGDLFNKISNTPKNYTIRYKYSKKDVGGGISYIRFNILGAEVDFLKKQFI